MPLGAMNNIFENECEKLSDRFDFLTYASVCWYRHVKSRQQVENEWNITEALLDHRQPLLGVWIRGHWESGRYICSDVLFTKDEALGIRISQLAIELDICWLTELILTDQMVGESFDDHQIIKMVGRSPDSFQYLCVSRKDIQMPENVLEASARSSHCKRGVQLLLEHRRAEVKITEKVIEAAESNQSHAEGKELLQLLLDQDDATNLKITDKSLRIAAQKRHGWLMRLFLTRRVERVDVLDELLKLAAK